MHTMNEKNLDIKEHTQLVVLVVVHYKNEVQCH